MSQYGTVPYILVMNSLKAIYNDVKMFNYKFQIGFQQILVLGNTVTVLHLAVYYI